MTIGINILYLIPNQVGGTEYYARSIISAFDSRTDENRYVLFCNKENEHTFDQLSDRYTIVTAPIFASNRLVRILYEQILLPFLVKKHNCDAIYSPGYIGPALVPGVKKVVTVHDTNWKDHPEDFSFIAYWATRIVTEFSMFFANTLVVSSEFAKERLLHYFSQYQHKTKVVWPGIEDGFKAALKTAPKPKIKKYLLTVSAFYPHKRIPYLLELFIELKKDLSFKDYSLVLIGNNGSDKERVLSLISKMKDVHYFPKVSYPELISYYAHAEFVIQPSVYEGFGYAVYEAVAAGKSVFVGKKDLYHAKVQEFLFALSFNLKNDQKLIAKNDVSKTKVTVALPKLFDYKKVIEGLLSTFS